MTNYQKKTSFWGTVWKLIGDYWITLMSGLIPIVLAFLNWLNNGNYSNLVPKPQQRERIEFWSEPLILLFTGLYFVFLALQLRQSKRLSTLKKENNSLRKQVSAYDRVVYETTDSFLSTFSKRVLKFGTSSGCDERITIYIHDDTGYFVPIGRYSENPNLKKRGRSKYHDAQGFIAKAWERDFCFANDYPNPNLYYKSYCQRLNRDNMSNDIIDKLTMKSSLLFGCRINDLQTEKPIALIILEATKNNRYKELQLKRDFGKIKTELTKIINRLEPIIPSISEPKELGL